MQVVRDGIGGVADPSPGQSHPPGQVGVLVVEEEVDGKPAQLSRGPGAQSTPATAEEPDVDRGVVGRPVGLSVPAVVARSPAAERAPRIVDPAAGRQHDPTGRGAHARVVLERGQEPGEPARFRGGVVVQIGDVLGAGALQARLGATGEPGVAGQPQHLHVRVPGQNLLGVVGGRVVHHQNPVRHRLHGQGIQARPEQMRPVPGDHDHRHPWLAGPGHPAALSGAAGPTRRRGRATSARSPSRPYVRWTTDPASADGRPR